CVVGLDLCPRLVQLFQDNGVSFMRRIHGRMFAHSPIQLSHNFTDHTLSVAHTATSRRPNHTTTADGNGAPAVAPPNRSRPRRNLTSWAIITVRRAAQS